MRLNLQKKLVVFLAALLAACFGAPAWGLAPLEGLLKGNVESIGQPDPLAKLLSARFTRAGESELGLQREKLENYKALFSLGANLVNSCEVERFYAYENQWKEESALRATAATLQYLGLDISARAIVEYAKAFKLGSDEFENIVNNLVENTCSQNISVFSKKLLRDNLFHMWKGDSSFALPSFKDSPFVAQNNFDKTEAFAAKQREFDFALKNFRDFCSWGGDTDNYRMLAPYLQNPYVMSLVISHMTGKAIAWDEERQASGLRDAPDSVMVACEDMICRKREPAVFAAMFPRMVGSASVRDDLEVLYCSHFRNTSLKGKDAGATIANWIQSQSLEESRLLPMSLVSLATGLPDFFFAIDRYPDIMDLFSSAIESRWDRWAKEQTENFALQLFYEESLYVDLRPASASQRAQGDLELVFDFTLGELDREIIGADKIGAKFILSLPKSYLAWARRNAIAAGNRSDYKKLEEVKANFASMVNAQLQKKADYFELELWNENFGSIISEELLNRLIAYQGAAYQELDQGAVEIPVRFRFGLFALKYLRTKYQDKYHLAP